MLLRRGLRRGKGITRGRKRKAIDLLFSRDRADGDGDGKEWGGVVVRYGEENECSWLHTSDSIRYSTQMDQDRRRRFACLLTRTHPSMSLGQCSEIQIL